MPYTGAWGDSIAAGLQQAYGLGGNAKVGLSPTAIADNIAQAIQKNPNQFRNSRPVISTGLSNNPQDWEGVRRQVSLLKNAGADPSFVGMAKGTYDEQNRQLQSLVSSSGFKFLGGFNPGADKVHPSSYSNLLPADSNSRSNNMPTTSQILGLTPQEKAAAIFTTSGEAGPGRDPLGVLQTILTRKFKSGGNITDLVKAPQQFVANDPYSRAQVMDPAYGSKVHGARYKQIEQMFENPSQMVQAFQTGQGAEQFRGQSLLGNKQKGDVMFDPKGNFYFQTNPGLAKSLSERLSKGVGVPTSQVPSTATQGTGSGQSQQTIPQGGNTFIVYTGDKEPTDALSNLKQFILDRGLSSSEFPSASTSQTNPYISQMQKILSAQPNYLS
jgi:hypothetical protein